MWAQLCLTLCHPVDCSPQGSSVHGISQKEYWSGLPCPHPGDLSDPGINLLSPVAPALYVDSLPLSQVCGYQQIVLINHEDSPWMEDYFVFFSSLVALLPLGPNLLPQERNSTDCLGHGNNCSVLSLKATL